jgi:hypothetical protein
LLTLSPAQDSANVNPCSSSSSSSSSNNSNSSRGHVETHKPGRSGRDHARQPLAYRGRGAGVLT